LVAKSFVHSFHYFYKPVCSGCFRGTKMVFGSFDSSHPQFFIGYLFALDVFGGPKWFLALLIHLIPSFLLVIFTIVSWKHGLLGGIIFCIAGIAFLVSSHFKAWVVSVPAVFIGLLFIAEKILFKNRLENKSR